VGPPWQGCGERLMGIESQAVMIGPVMACFYRHE
jgi:hypothetical protein